MKKIACLLIIMINVNIGYTQSDSIFNEINNEFESFSKSVDKEFNTIKSQNDSAFLIFLKQTWQEFDLFLNEQPLRPKPLYQPQIKEKADTGIERIETLPFDDGIINPKNQVSDTDLKEKKDIVYQSRAVVKSFSIFGIEAKIFYYPERLPQLSNTNEESILSFYRYLTHENLMWNYNINEFNKIKILYHLNDWGYYLLIKKATENLFDTKNEQILLLCYLLENSNYKVKIGYDDNIVYLLFPAQQELYNILYLPDNGIKYYLFHEGKNQATHIKTCSGNSRENTKIFSFALSELPKLNIGKLENKELMYKKNNIDFKFDMDIMKFLETYPQCEFSVYFNSPISLKNINALDKIFIPIFKWKTNQEKVNILLDLIQGSFIYKLDQEQFGQENYMFAEECLYYPFSDCEDRAFLLSQLVKHYTNLPVIGLEFQNHLNIGVNFPDLKYGDYVLFKEKKYFICDPTYINAKIGMIPEDLKNEKPKIIVF